MDYSSYNPESSHNSSETPKSEWVFFKSVSPNPGMWPFNVWRIHRDPSLLNPVVLQTSKSKHKNRRHKHKHDEMHYREYSSSDSSSDEYSTSDEDSSCYSDDEDEEHLDFDLKGYKPMYPGEYFRAILSNLEGTDEKTVKHIYRVAENARQISMKTNEPEITRGFNSIKSKIEKNFPKARDKFKSYHDIEKTNSTLSSMKNISDSILVILADEQTKKGLLKKFKKKSKEIKTVVAPNFCDVKDLPDEHDYRILVSEHNHLIFFCSIVLYMKDYIRGHGIVSVTQHDEMKDISSSSEKYLSTLENGIDIAIKNQLKRWRYGLKFMFKRGMMIHYKNVSGFDDKIKEIIDNNWKIFYDKFYNIMLTHVVNKLDVIKQQLKDKYDSPEVKEKTQKAFGYIRSDVAPLWANVTLSALGQKKDALESTYGQIISFNFERAFIKNSKKVFGYAKVLSVDGFNRDPVKLKEMVDKSHEGYLHLGQLINSIAYGMAGEPNPKHVVKKLMITEK